MVSDPNFDLDGEVCLKNAVRLLGIIVPLLKARCEPMRQKKCCVCARSAFCTQVESKDKEDGSGEDGMTGSGAKEGMDPC